MLSSDRSDPALLRSPACGQIEWKRWHSYVLLILVGVGQLFWKAFDFYSQGAETCFMNFIVWRSKGGWRYSICSRIKLVRAQKLWAAGGRSGEKHFVLSITYFSLQTRDFFHPPLILHRRAARVYLCVCEAGNVFFSDRASISVC